MPGNGNGQAGAQRDQPCDIAALRALLQRCAPYHVVNFRAVDSGALNRGFERISAKRGTGGGIETAFVSAPDGGAGGGDDNGITHWCSPVDC